MTKKLDTRYYAVPDPTTGDMTFWYRNKKGELDAWPTRPKTRYGPRLFNSLKREPGAHDYIIPSGLENEEQYAWHCNWIETVRKPWMDAIKAEIGRDPETCMARFAAIQSRCAICGKALDDPESKASGIGPECRKGLPDAFITAIQEETRAALGHVDLEADIQRVKDAGLIFKTPPPKKPRRDWFAEAPAPKGEHGMIIRHDAVMGTRGQAARKWWISEPKPYAQHPVAVSVNWIEPGKRTAQYIMVHGDSRYVTIEEGGRTVYDSRNDVPCDMDAWHETAARFKDRPAVRIIHH